MLTFRYRRVLLYETQSQEQPAQDFLDSLPLKVAGKIIWTLNLAENLQIIPVKYFSKMSGTDDIWEFRIEYGSNIYRVFSFWDENLIIATHGFIKKSQKTPRTEIERAHAYKNDYFERRHKGDLR